MIDIKFGWSPIDIGIQEVCNRLATDALRDEFRRLLVAMKASSDGDHEDVMAIPRFLAAFTESLPSDDEVKRCTWYRKSKARPGLADRVRCDLFGSLTDRDLLRLHVDCEDSVSHNTGTIEGLLHEFDRQKLLGRLEELDNLEHHYPTFYWGRDFLDEFDRLVVSMDSDRVSAGMKSKTLAGGSQKADV